MSCRLWPTTWPMQPCTLADVPPWGACASAARTCRAPCADGNPAIAECWRLLDAIVVSIMERRESALRGGVLPLHAPALPHRVSDVTLPSPEPCVRVVARGPRDAAGS